MSDSRESNLQSLYVLLDLLLADQRCQGLDPSNEFACSTAIELCLADYLTGPVMDLQLPDYADVRTLVRAVLAEVVVPEPIVGDATDSMTQASDDAHPILPIMAPIPDTCVLTLPHAYARCGAPYADGSPFQLREAVAQRLAQAQAWLGEKKPGFRLEIFDAYRPVSVQAYMVAFTLKEALAAEGIAWDVYAADPEQPIHQQLRQRVSEIWAQPSLNPRTPPPHSTGAAVDLTILDASGKALPMGCPIDHLGPESEANFYVRHGQQHEQAHENRTLLYQCMHQAGFRRLPHEWWHFSYGDQWWALLNALNTALVASRSETCLELPLRAHYGRVDTVVP